MNPLRDSSLPHEGETARIGVSREGQRGGELPRNLLVEVAVPGPFDGGLHYTPPHSNSAISPGMRVVVPLGRRHVVGVVTAVLPAPADTSLPFSLKPIERVLDAAPLYSPVLLALIEWVSRYYHHPLGDTFQTALIGALADPEPLTLRPLDRYVLTDAGKAALQDSAVKRARQQAKLLEHLATAGPAGCLKSELHAAVDGAIDAPLRALHDKGWITHSPELPTLRTVPASDFPKTLSEEQRHVLTASQRVDNFEVQCLEGVTGSGKTEIYLQRIAPLLAAGKQVLVLVPEIGLTPQTIQRFQARFGVPTVALHSGLNDTERKTALFHALHGHAQLIIGTRSAVFIPTHQLGMILIDEEHDLSFKQQNGLRYHARDVAIKRAQLENIPILLGSATPSLETLHHALSGKYRHLQLRARVSGSALPTPYCIPMKAQKGLVDGLSVPLIDAIRTHLSAGNQVLIFINRRGYAPMVMCHECGWQAMCPRCDKAYTLHVHPSRLLCHHCGAQKPVPMECPTCQNAARLTDVGTGTEKIELALKTLFPSHTVLRIDRSNTTQKQAMEKHLAQIQRGEADILVGTQMLAKGHHFERLTLVGMVKIDDALFSNDFRSSEHLGQLITQVSGRAGREQRPGEVYLQTAHPDHPLLTLLLKDGYSSYARTLLDERQRSGFPPFSHLAVIRAESHHLDKNHAALTTLKTVASSLESTSDVCCLGPFPAFLAKRGGIHRSALLVQAPSRQRLHAALDEMDRYRQQHPFKQVRVFVDVDPVELE